MGVPCIPGGLQGCPRDPLIGVGTAPLDDPLFRSALFEQLGEIRLEGAVTTDICGKKDAHAMRLDKEAEDAVEEGPPAPQGGDDHLLRVQRRAGQGRGHGARGPPGRRRARTGHRQRRVGAGGLVVVVLLPDRRAEQRYRFSLSPNLNKLLADRRANIAPTKIEEKVRDGGAGSFPEGQQVELVPFPEKSGQVPDRPMLTFVVLAPNQSMNDNEDDGNSSNR